MSALFFPASGVVPDSTLLFCDGPVWIGVRIDGVEPAEILAALERAVGLVRLAASYAPRGEGSPEKARDDGACVRADGCVCIHAAPAWERRLRCQFWTWTSKPGRIGA